MGSGIWELGRTRFSRASMPGRSSEKGARHSVASLLESVSTSRSQGWLGSGTTSTRDASGRMCPLSRPRHKVGMPQTLTSAERASARRDTCASASPFRVLARQTSASLVSVQLCRGSLPSHSVGCAWKESLPSLHTRAASAVCDGMAWRGAGRGGVRRGEEECVVGWRDRTAWGRMT